MKKIANLLRFGCLATPLAAMMLSASAATAAEPIMRASKEIVYEPEGSSWVFADSVLFTYNTLGLPVKEIRSDSTVVSTEYDAAGRMIRETSEHLNPDGSLTLFKVRTRTYDELTGTTTESREVNYIGGTAQDGNCSTRTIKRNADGNIESVEIAVPYHGVYDPIERLSISYGDDGKAAEIRKWHLTAGAAQEEFYWAEGESYTDIVWENTDGQIVSTDDFYRGNNRIRSAHYVNQNNGKPYYDHTINVTYEEEEGNPGYRSVVRGLYQGFENSGVIRKYAETENADGSSEQRLDTSYFTYGEDDSMIDPENYIDRARTDSKGNQILVEQIFWERDATGKLTQEVIERTKTDYTYDPTTGLIQRMVVSEYDPESRRLAPMIRIDSFDYVDCTALNAAPSIEATRQPQEGITEYYDLGGRRIAHPGSGIFIRRSGSESRVVRL